MKRLFICVVGLIVTATMWSRTFDMKQLGADPRGMESCTRLINQTIEKAFSEGGGTLYFPAGTYLTATIQMKSNITLYLESGASSATIRRSSSSRRFCGVAIWQDVHLSAISIKK